MNCCNGGHRGVSGCAIRFWGCRGHGCCCIGEVAPAARLCSTALWEVVPSKGLGRSHVTASRERPPRAARSAIRQQARVPPGSVALPTSLVHRTRSSAPGPLGSGGSAAPALGQPRSRSRRSTAPRDPPARPRSAGRRAAVAAEGPPLARRQNAWPRRWSQGHDREPGAGAATAGADASFRSTERPWRWQLP